jgi:catechol 2,3-dioxygenase-like lactoylglutathione lyase family enzyme
VVNVRRASRKADVRDDSPDAIDHLSFHLDSMRALREALETLKKNGVELEDPGEEIGPTSPGSPHMGLWFHDPDGYRWELSVQNGARDL